MIFSLNVKLHLWFKLYTVPFFVSGQTYKISKGSNNYCSHCMCVCRFNANAQFGCRGTQSAGTSWVWRSWWGWEEGERHLPALSFNTHQPCHSTPTSPVTQQIPALSLNTHQLSHSTPTSPVTQHLPALSLYKHQLCHSTPTSPVTQHLPALSLNTYQPCHSTPTNPGTQDPPALVWGGILCYWEGVVVLTGGWRLR